MVWSGVLVGRWAMVVWRCCLIVKIDWRSSSKLEDSRIENKDDHDHNVVAAARTAQQTLSESHVLDAYG